MAELQEIASRLKNYSRNEVRIVLIGKAGSGKSKTGNTLLGGEEFESRVSATSVTSKCQSASALHENKRLLVVDTPGFFDTNVDNDLTSKEIMKCIGLTAPGIHAVVLVTKVGRFTQEEQQTDELFKEHFGEDVKKYMIIVFTGKDDLVRGNLSLEEFVKESPDKLQNLVAECENRILAVDNTVSLEENKSFRDELLKMIDDMVKKNGCGCYSTEMYEQVETLMLTRQREIRAMLDEQEQKKKREEELMEEYETMSSLLRQKDKKILKMTKDFQAFIDREMPAVKSLNLNFDYEKHYGSEDHNDEKVKGQKSEKKNYDRCDSGRDVKRGGEDFGESAYESIRLENTEGNEYAERAEARKEIEEERGFFAFFIKTYDKIRKLFQG